MTGSLPRRFLRWLGFNVHKGWRDTHWTGFDIECVGCGERRSCYQLGGSRREPSWWETTASGDGSCGPIAEFPARFY